MDKREECNLCVEFASGRSLLFIFWEKLKSTTPKTEIDIRVMLRVS